MLTELVNVELPSMDSRGAHFPDKSMCILYLPKGKMLNLKKDYWESYQGDYQFIGAQPIFYSCILLRLLF